MIQSREYCVADMKNFLILFVGTFEDCLDWLNNFREKYPKDKVTKNLSVVFGEEYSDIFYHHSNVDVKGVCLYLRRGGY